MFAIREINNELSLDPDFPDRKYVIETNSFELALLDWDGTMPGDEYDSDDPPAQVLFTLREAEALVRAMDAASTLLEERCEHCGAVLEPDMEDE